MKQLNWYQIFGKSNIPDGRTVLPTDDIQIWLHCANIWNKAYTTLAEVLSDTTTLLALINSPNAVDYMVRSTTWAVAQALVPTMTSNTTPSGECICSPFRDPYDAYYAFDNDASTKYVSDYAKSTPCYVGYRFTSAIKADKATIVFGTAHSTTFKIQASNDGNAWTDVSSSITTSDLNYTVSLTAGAEYLYYRMYISAQSGSFTYGGQIVALQFYSASITDNATAMSYIGLNNYCANTLLADSTWCEAICNSEYFESVLNAKVPKMTSNNTPSGECSASSVYSSTYPAWKAFDGNDSTHWSSTSADSTNAWIQYKFTDAVKVYLAKINVTSSGSSLCCKSVSIKASNDGETFVELLEKQTIANNTSISSHLFVISPLTSYEYYRLAEMGTYTSDVDLNTVQFYGRVDV